MQDARHTTLLEFIWSTQNLSRSEGDVIAEVVREIDAGRVVLCGIFAGTRRIGKANDRACLVSGSVGAMQ